MIHFFGYPARFPFGRHVLAACGLLASVTGLFSSPVPSGKPAAYPAWWFERDVIVRTNPSNGSPAWPGDYPASDDFVALNQGQLKNIAAKAYAELQAKMPASVWSTTEGAALAALISGWTGSPTADDYAAVNQGQLKTVAQKFYDVLALPQVGYIAGLGLPPAGWTNGAYLWSAATTDDDAYAAANLGQAKHLFSFNVDADGDGLAGSWEIQYGFDPNVALSQDPAGLLHDGAYDSDGDSLTNLQEYQGGSDPQDYYNGAAPTLEIIQGDNQTGQTGAFAADTLQLKVKNGSTALVNAPVTFTVVGGGSNLAYANTGSPTLYSTVTLRTDANGIAVKDSGGTVRDLYVQLPASAGTLQVQVTVSGYPAVTATFDLAANPPLAPLIFLKAPHEAAESD